MPRQPPSVLSIPLISHAAHPHTSPAHPHTAAAQTPANGCNARARCSGLAISSYSKISRPPTRAPSATITRSSTWASSSTTPITQAHPRTRALSRTIASGPYTCATSCTQQSPSWRRFSSLSIYPPRSPRFTSPKSLSARIRYTVRSPALKQSPTNNSYFFVATLFIDSLNASSTTVSVPQRLFNLWPTSYKIVKDSK